MAKKSTIKDIARKLGVSKTLVSFVLTGKSKEKRISEEMTQKVLDVAREMNYQPNHSAKSLRTGKSHTIGLIIADISNPFFAKFARFIEIEASKYNYKVVFGNSDEQNEKFSIELDVLKNGQVDGFILTPPIGSEKELRRLQKQNIPFVVVDRVFESVETHSVIINNYQSAYQATERLIANGRNRIAILNVNNQLSTMEQRMQGYRGALEKNDIALDSTLIKDLQFSHEKSLIMTALQELIDTNADGILFTTSKLCMLGIECLRELGIAIPDQLAVISFDDIDAYRVAYTPISAIVQPIEQMSKDAVRILMSMLDGNYQHNEFERIVHDVNFVFRESCS